jgi:hypothetical protein
MKKLIVAGILSVFAASTAYACDGMKEHAKGDKAGQTDSASAKKDSKSGTKTDSKS